ncbi:MAG: hypothetical protein A4E48_01076 [Methanosaeta sp. PtaU1.Bin060]|nr:MAG: hypothetical protein A4E48_01076 [Methanosaeta sp. PtaU1.Bin060]
MCRRLLGGAHAYKGSIRAAGYGGDFSGRIQLWRRAFTGGGTYLPAAWMTKGTITLKGEGKTPAMLPEMEIAQME